MEGRPPDQDHFRPSRVSGRACSATGGRVSCRSNDERGVNSMSDEQPSEFDHERWLAAIAPQLPYKIEIPPPLEEDDEKPAADDSAGDALCRRPTTVEEREAFYRDREEHGRRIDPATA